MTPGTHPDSGPDTPLKPHRVIRGEGSSGDGEKNDRDRSNPEASQRGESRSEKDRTRLTDLTPTGPSVPVMSTVSTESLSPSSLVRGRVLPGTR